MRGHLSLVVANLGLGNGAHGVVGLALGRRVVGRQDGGHGPDHGAHLVVHLLGLGLVEDALERGALERVRGGGGGVLGVRGDGD